VIVSIPRCGCQGKPAKVIARRIVAEIVEQQERIEIGGVAEAERTLQLDAGALNGGRRVEELLDGTDGHVGFSLK